MPSKATKKKVKRKPPKKASAAEGARAVEEPTAQSPINNAPIAAASQEAVSPVEEPAPEGGETTKEKRARIERNKDLRQKAALRERTQREEAIEREKRRAANDASGVRAPEGVAPINGAKASAAVRSIQIPLVAKQQKLIIALKGGYTALMEKRLAAARAPFAQHYALLDAKVRQQYEANGEPTALTAARDVYEDTVNEVLEDAERESGAGMVATAFEDEKGYIECMPGKPRKERWAVTENWSG